MNLFLRPLEDVNDVTWSIIWCLIILLAGVFYVIVYILGIDERESNGSNDTPKQEELLQLQSSGDQSCPRQALYLCLSLGSCNNSSDSGVSSLPFASRSSMPSI